MYVEKRKEEEGEDPPPTSIVLHTVGGTLGERMKEATEIVGVYGTDELTATSFFLNFLAAACTYVCAFVFVYSISITACVSYFSFSLLSLLRFFR